MSTPTATPDAAGFAAAADNLRAQLGTMAEFQVPIDPEWPEGTKINPDTARPYDPTIKPTSARFTTVEKRILIILKQGSPLRPQADTYWEQAGMLSGMDVIIDISAGDYADIAAASEMVINGLTYKIEEAKPFSLGGSVYRHLVYGKER